MVRQASLAELVERKEEVASAKPRRGSLLYTKAILMAAIAAGVTVTAFGWDVEHDEVAQLTGESLPAEIKAQFDFDDFGVLMANCHFPDGTEWEPRRFRDLDDLEAIGPEVSR